MPCPVVAGGEVSRSVVFFGRPRFLVAGPAESTWPGVFLPVSDPVTDDPTTDVPTTDVPVTDDPTTDDPTTTDANARANVTGGRAVGGTGLLRLSSSESLLAPK